MARVKLTEYKAKLLLVDDYEGVSIRLETLKDDIRNLSSKTKYIIKVDQGIKKRGKQGLIRLNVSKTTAAKAVKELSEKGYRQFIAEPMVSHDDKDEQYLSIERTREGMKILHSANGGVDIEDHPETIRQYASPDKVPLPQLQLQALVDTMNREHFSFLEINPFLINNDTMILLDAAVIADSTGMPQAQWTKQDIAEGYSVHASEEEIARLNEGSSASFSFKVLNAQGAVWLLLSGGGASITIADEAANKGKAGSIGNYGEYSGGPTQEETQLYAEVVIKQMLQSNAKKQALVIAGGVANFTDVKKTFSGIIETLSKYVEVLREKEVLVYVRRGGPNERAGLKLMKDFLEQNGILGSVYGSEKVLTTVIDEALEYVDV